MVHKESRVIRIKEENQTQNTKHKTENKKHAQKKKKHATKTPHEVYCTRRAGRRAHATRVHVYGTSGTGGVQRVLSRGLVTTVQSLASPVTGGQTATGGRGG